MKFGLVEVSESGPKRSYPANLLLNSDLLTLSERVLREKHPVDILFPLSNRGLFLTTGIYARQLGNFVLIGASSYRPIQARNSEILFWLTLASVSLLIVTSFSAVLLAEELGVSVNRISMALQLIQNHCYSVVPIGGDDQFGRVQNGISRAAQTLGGIYAAIPVQQTLLFQGNLASNRITIDSRYFPGQFLGNDYLESICLPDKRVLFAIGEATGEAIPATMLIARVKMALYLWSEIDPDPSGMMGKLNELLLSRRLHSTQMRIILGVAGPGQGVTIANAGHVAPILLSPKKESGLETATPCLGKEPINSFPSFSFDLGRDSSLVLYSKSWLEYMDPLASGTGFQRFKDTLEKVQSPDLPTLLVRLDDSRTFPAKEMIEDRSIMLIRISSREQ